MLKYIEIEDERLCLYIETYVARVLDLLMGITYIHIYMCVCEKVCLSIRLLFMVEWTDVLWSLIMIKSRK